jgi:hypothetical protein
MSLSHHQNAGQNHDIEVGNRWFENVAQFRYSYHFTFYHQSLITSSYTDSKGSMNLALNDTFYAIQCFCNIVEFTLKMVAVRYQTALCHSQDKHYQ